MIDTKKIVDELGGELSEKVIEIEDLNDLVAEKEREIVRVKEEITTAAHLAPEEKKQTVKGQVDDLVKKSKMQERQIKGLVEKIQLKEAEVCHCFRFINPSLLISWQFTNKTLNLKGMTDKEYIMSMRN